MGTLSTRSSDQSRCCAIRREQRPGQWNTEPAKQCWKRWPFLAMAAAVLAQRPLHPGTRKKGARRHAMQVSAAGPLSPRMSVARASPVVTARGNKSCIAWASSATYATLHGACAFFSTIGRAHTQRDPMSASGGAVLTYSHAPLTCGVEAMWCADSSASFENRTRQLCVTPNFSIATACGR